LKTNNNDTKPKRDRSRHEKGATLTEVLVAFSIITFVMTTIVGGIIRQQATVKSTDERNAAVLLAEMKIEELFKFPADQQLDNDKFQEYIRYVNGGFEQIATSTGTAPLSMDDKWTKVLRRVTEIKRDLMRQMATISITVQFGSKYNKSKGQYDFSNTITMNTRRALL